MSWGQLVSIYREAIEEARAERARPPVACPNDGTVLISTPGGVLFCSFDGWRWNGTTG